MTSGHDRLNRSFADVLDRAQPEADRWVPIGLLLDGEIQAGAVDVRGEHLDPQTTALGNEEADLLGVVSLHAQQCGHIFDRVLGLEVGGLAGEDSIVSRMRLVESVPGEVLDIAEYRLGCLVGQPTVLYCSLDKGGTMLK